MRDAAGFGGIFGGIPETSYLEAAVISATYGLSLSAGTAHEQDF